MRAIVAGVPDPSRPAAAAIELHAQRSPSADLSQKDLDG
jgi:hypothetical protein